MSMYLAQVFVCALRSHVPDNTWSPTKDSEPQLKQRYTEPANDFILSKPGYMECWTAYNSYAGASHFALGKGTGSDSSKVSVWPVVTQQLNLPISLILGSAFVDSLCVCLCLCVCACLRVHVCVCLHLRSQPLTPVGVRTWLCETSVCVHVCVHVCVCMCMCMCSCLHLRVCSLAPVGIRGWYVRLVCVHVCACVCLHMYVVLCTQPLTPMVWPLGMITIKLLLIHCSSLCVCTHISMTCSIICVLCV